MHWPNFLSAHSLKFGLKCESKFEVSLSCQKGKKRQNVQMFCWVVSHCWLTIKKSLINMFCSHLMMGITMQCFSLTSAQLCFWHFGTQYSARQAIAGTGCLSLHWTGSYPLYVFCFKFCSFLSPKKWKPLIRQHTVILNDYIQPRLCRVCPPISFCHATTMSICWLEQSFPPVQHHKTELWNFF